MAIVFSYPSLNSNEVQPSDRLLLSQMTVEGNPTKSLTINNLRQYLGAVVPANPVTGSGTTNRLTKWKAPVGSGVIEDSSIEDTGSEINVPYRLNINNATTPNDGISFINPSGLPSGIVRMYYNGAVQGSRFLISRGASGGAEIELEASGDVNINRTGIGNFLVGGEVTLDDYGAGTITGTPTFYLAVDTNGKIIEESSAGGIGGGGTLNQIPKFDPNGTTLADSIISESGNRIDITGELTVSQLPVDFGASQYLFEGGGAEFLQPLDMKGNKIADLPTPVLGTDAVNKNYVDALGYKSLQVFQWTAGNPTGYQNYPIGAPAAFLPFDPTPLVQNGTYSGTSADFAWTCVNVAAVQPPSPTPVEAEFTLGADGAGVWEVKTCQHWFDQNQFLEVNISFTINGTVVDVIDQRVNDGAGDRIYNGYLFRDFSAGDVLKVRVIFANGTGSSPFPSDLNNRPIEISFNKIV
tara:strand:- start:814 stop:2214 length:1401 start_codon:yes stop_codon:yes gene_type:complete